MFNINSQIVSRDTRLTKGARLLMAEIISLSKMQLGCIVKDKKLAKYIGVTTRSIQTYLSELKKYKYIAIHTEQENEENKPIRIITPTANIMISIKTATNNYHKAKKNKNKPKDIEVDWLEDYIANME